MSKKCEEEEKITFGQMNQQPHFDVMYEIRCLIETDFEDHMTCILTVDDAVHMKKRKVSMHH